MNLYWHAINQRSTVGCLRRRKNMRSFGLSRIDHASNMNAARLTARKESLTVRLAGNVLIKSHVKPRDKPKAVLTTNFDVPGNRRQSEKQISEASSAILPVQAIAVPLMPSSLLRIQTAAT